MPWNDLIGHRKVVDRFQRSFENGRLANTYLLVGKDGIGKRQFAFELARVLFCQNRSEFQSCGTCPSCVQVHSRTHPDLILISKPSDKNFLPVELFVGDREHRRQRGLCHDINLTPFSGDRKVAIVDDADFFNAESANSLLKILEEPPHDSVLILIGTSEHRQLPTILSRCQVIRFEALSHEQVLGILKLQQIEFQVDVDKLAAAASGSVSRAIELNDEELFAFRNELFSRLATMDPADGQFSKSICDHVDSTSKESAVKRKRMGLIGEFAVELYSDCLRYLHNSQPSSSGIELETIQRIASQRSVEVMSTVLAALIERTLEFQKHVETNMAMANIVPSWLNDLGALSRREQLVTN